MTTNDTEQKGGLGGLPIETQQLAIGLVFIFAIFALVLVKGLMKDKSEDELGEIVLDVAEPAAPAETESE